MKISNSKILITGGATGISLGLTERFLKEDNTVIVCGQTASVLKELGGFSWKRFLGISRNDGGGLRIVPSHHGTLQTKECIAKVERILKEHLAKSKR